MSQEIFNKLKDFVIKESSVDDEEITRGNKIDEDLGVTGDDAMEFLVAYGKNFDVDISQFMAADYFNGEGIDILSPIISTITGKKKSPKKNLTVGHLEKGILAGRLDDEIING